MKIALINGSPKPKGSTSAAILKDLKMLLPSDATIDMYYFNKDTLSKETITQLNQYDSLVFAFPLYIDGLPSHLLACLVAIEQEGLSNKGLHIYGIANCGFHEGEQNTLAITILHNWCDRVGLHWGMGIGIGGGPPLSSMGDIPIGKGPKRSLLPAFTSLALAISTKHTKEDHYVSISFPRFLYKHMAEIGWMLEIKSNGKKISDLKHRY